MNTSRTRLFIPLTLLWIAGMAAGDEPRVSPRADRPPRKVVVGTVIFGPYGSYPGLEARVRALTALVDEMAARAAQLNPARGLDLAILPESAVTSTSGKAAARAVPLKGPVADSFGALARKHRTYLIVPLDLAEDGPAGRFESNAAVLFDRSGQVVGIYRKMHPVAYVNSDELESGITPGRAAPVFECDFGKLGIQICWDIQFPETWHSLADAGAELVAWPTASPATLMPSAYAAKHRYHVVSSTWRDNATVYEPTGMVAARVEGMPGVLVHEVDLSFAILGWSGFLKNGEALREKYGKSVGFHYDVREDMGLFWSNDPRTPIGTMVRSIGGEELDLQVARNRRLYGGVPVASPRVSLRNPADRIDVASEGGAVVLSVTSPRGIGGATIERAGERWPSRVTVVLRLRGLESVTLSDGSVTVAGSATRQSPPHSQLTVRRGSVEQPIGRADPLWTEIRATDAGGFRLDVPAGLLTSNPKALTLEWVDFFRN